MRYAFPFDVEPQPQGGYTLTVPDISAAITEGDTEEEAVARARDCLVPALSFYAMTSGAFRHRHPRAVGTLPRSPRSRPRSWR